MQVTLSVTGIRRIGLAVAMALALVAFLGFSLDLGSPGNAEAALSGDVNGDGVVNPLDATLILQFSAGLLPEVPSKATDTPMPTHAPIDTPTNTPTTTQTNTPTQTLTPTPAPPDLSGTWDAHYSLRCDAVFAQEATGLSATVNCGALAVGTLNGPVDADDGSFSLSGQLGALTVSIEGLIVDDDAFSGTYSAPPFAEEGTIEAFRVAPGTGTDLTGEWVLLFADIFSVGCILEIGQLGVDLTTRMDCVSVSSRSIGADLEGTVEGSAVTLMGPLPGFGNSTLLLEATLAEDGDSFEGSWRITSLALTGSFTASRQSSSAGSFTNAKLWRG